MRWGQPSGRKQYLKAALGTATPHLQQPTPTLLPSKLCQANPAVLLPCRPTRHCRGKQAPSATLACKNSRPKLANTSRCPPPALTILPPSRLQLVGALVEAAERPQSPGAITPATVALIVDLLCFCVSAHSYRIT